MKLEEAMGKIKAEVDAELRRFFNAKRKEAESIHPALVDLVDQIADVTLRGGKRIRPFLCRVGYAAVTRDKRHVTSTAPRELLSAMLGLELFQTFALIHDDIMDQDSQRRGGPTIHEYFRVTCQLSPVAKAARLGENMAILAGDLALAWADITISKIKDQKSKMMYQKMKEEVIYGQTLDVMRSIGVKGVEKSRADELKTAWYSVVRPLQIGSSFAFKDSLSERLSLLNTWELYGLAVGRLFQLRDDVLDGSLTNETFKKEAETLQNQALEALEAPDEVKQLLIDFIQFVQKRNS